MGGHRPFLLSFCPQPSRDESTRCQHEPGGTRRDRRGNCPAPGGRRGDEGGTGPPWPTGLGRPSEAASVATLVRPPAEGSLALTAALANSLENPALISLAPPPLANDAIRVNHTGLEANLPAVLSAVEALASGMRALGYDADLAAALEMAGETWSANEAADELSV